MPATKITHMQIISITIINKHTNRSIYIPIGWIEENERESNVEWEDLTVCVRRLPMKLCNLNCLSLILSGIGIVRKINSIRDYTDMNELQLVLSSNKEKPKYNHHGRWKTFPQFFISICPVFRNFYHHKEWKPKVNVEEKQEEREENIENMEKSESKEEGEGESSEVRGDYCKKMVIFSPLDADPSLFTQITPTKQQEVLLDTDPRAFSDENSAFSSPNSVPIQTIH